MQEYAHSLSRREQPSAVTWMKVDQDFFSLPGLYVHISYRVMICFGSIYVVFVAQDHSCLMFDANAVNDKPGSSSLCLNNHEINGLYMQHS